MSQNITSSIKISPGNPPLFQGNGQLGPGKVSVGLGNVVTDDYSNIQKMNEILPRKLSKICQMGKEVEERCHGVQGTLLIFYGNIDVLSKISKI